MVERAKPSLMYVVKGSFPTSLWRPPITRKLECKAGSSIVPPKANKEASGDRALKEGVSESPDGQKRVPLPPERPDGGSMPRAGKANAAPRVKSFQKMSTRKVQPQLQPQHPYSYPHHRPPSRPLGGVSSFRTRVGGSGEGHADDCAEGGRALARILQRQWETLVPSSLPPLASEGSSSSSSSRGSCKGIELAHRWALGPPFVLPPPSLSPSHTPINDDDEDDDWDLVKQWDRHVSMVKEGAALLAAATASLGREGGEGEGDGEGDASLLHLLSPCCYASAPTVDLDGPLMRERGRSSPSPLGSPLGSPSCVSSIRTYTTHDDDGKGEEEGKRGGGAPTPFSIDAHFVVAVEEEEEGARGGGHPFHRVLPLAGPQHRPGPTFIPLAPLGDTSSQNRGEGGGGGRKYPCPCSHLIPTKGRVCAPPLLVRGPCDAKLRATWSWTSDTSSEVSEGVHEEVRLNLTNARR